jgi:hypothetical protein
MQSASNRGPRDASVHAAVIDASSTHRRKIVVLWLVSRVTTVLERLVARRLTRVGASDRRAQDPCRRFDLTYWKPRTTKGKTSRFRSVAWLAFRPDDFSVESIAEKPLSVDDSSALVLGPENPKLACPAHQPQRRLAMHAGISIAWNKSACAGA